MFVAIGGEDDAHLGFPPVLYFQLQMFDVFFERTGLDPDSHFFHFGDMVLDPLSLICQVTKLRSSDLVVDG